MTRFRWLAGLLVVSVCSAAMGQMIRLNTTCADFPPGAFSDGGRYDLADFDGKVLVLYFFEPVSQKARGRAAERNELAEKFRDKPVRFIGVAVGATPSEAQMYAASSKLAMPVFADTLGLMQRRYDLLISMDNIYQFRIIGADGTLKGTTPREDVLQSVLEEVKWKYKDAGYHPKLNLVIELLEWNQTEAGLRLLRPMLKKKDEAGESAKKLYDLVLADGKKWAGDAAAAEAKAPAKAFDLHSRVVACFPDEPIGKTSADALKRLRNEPAVKDELAARKAMEAVTAAMSRPRPDSRQGIQAAAQQVAKKYKDTPTGQKAAALAEEIAAAPAMK